MAVSDTPSGDDPDEPTIRRPRLSGAGARDNDPPTTGTPDAPGTLGTAASTTGSAGTTGTTEPANTPGTTGTPSTTGTQSGAQTDATGSTAATGTAKAKWWRKWLRKRSPAGIDIAVVAVVVALALCAGALVVAAWIHDGRSSAAEARESRLLRDADCLELETRLNRLTPPGSTVTPVTRATAVQDENAAVRIYLTRSRNQRDADAWRQLVDARTAYAESLQQQAKTRTPAFYVAPRTNDGRAVADQLAQWSPAPCAGAIRRLAAPDL